MNHERIERRETGDDLQTELDRLAGGDLTKAETRRLVERLDAEPDGWKRCALAYLEAQSWRGTFRSLAGSNGRGPHSATRGTVSRPREKAARIRLAATVAAAFLLGAGLTWVWQRSLDRPAEPAQIVQKETGNRPNPPAPQRKAPGKRKHKAGVLGLVSVSANGVTESAFPVIRTADDQTVAVELAPSELTEYDLRLWERRGFRVEQHRKVVSVQLADGKAFQFPVDWVQYRYVGEQVY